MNELKWATTAILALNLWGSLSTAVGTASKRTVGELLQQANRGAGVNLGKKESIALPKTQDVFSPQKSGSINLGQVKPPKSNSFFDTGDDKAKLEKILEQQIRELFKLAQKFRGSNQRGEMWLRLAELYVEKAGLIDFRKQGDFDTKLKNFHDGKSKVKPKLDLSDAREYNRKAIQLYEGFVRDFPKDSKMDQALFFLGYNHYEIGELKKGTAYYEKLSKEYPSSSYVVEAKFALAEYYFENEKWTLARDNYATVLRVRSHRLYSFSLYKYAWCFFRNGDTKEALKWMELLIRRNREMSQAASEGRKSVSKVRLESEGLRDIVIMYAEVADAAKAPSYFKDLAGKDALGYLEKLGYYYADKGNSQGSKDVFKYLINSNPTAAKAFDYQYQIVKLYGTAKKSREFREEIFYWTKNFGPEGAWVQANSANKELVENALKLTETTLRNYVLQQHQTAQNSHAPFSQNLALEGYRLYFSDFKASLFVADMHFYFGELLYDMGKFEEASLQYKWVVENGQNSKFFAKAADNIMIALEKEVPKDAEISARVGQSMTPVQFESKVAKFVDLGKWYLAKFPDSEKGIEVKFKIGRMLYQHNQFDQAIPYFRELITKNPKTKQAEYSANLLLDAFNLKKDYVGLEKAAGELLLMPNIANSKAGADIRVVLEKASFKKAQDLEVAKDYGGSAIQFEAFAKQHPKSNLAVSAIFNSAINFERAGLSLKAISAHVAVLNLKVPAADSLKPKSHRILAKLYQDSGMISEAAAMYSVSAQDAGNDPLAPNFLFNAAILYEAMGKKSEAIHSYELYVSKIRGAERGDAIFAVAALHRKTSSLAKAVEYYRSFLTVGDTQPEKQVEAAYWLFDISRQLGRNKDAEEFKRKTLAIQSKFAPEKKGVGAAWAAKIKFEDVLVVYNQYREISLPANPKRQADAVKRKIDMLGQINRALAEIINFDSPDEIVGALSILGQTNLHMGESLVNAPLPAGLTESETKTYKASVQQLADEKYFKSAKESLSAAVSRASELDAYTKYYEKARELISKWDPKSYYEGAEISYDMKIGSWMGL